MERSEVHPWNALFSMTVIPSGRVMLVSRKDGEAERLSIRYTLHRLGREIMPIAGDCAVVAINGQCGKMREAGAEELEAAQVYVRPKGA